MKRFLSFDRLFTPIIVQILYVMLALLILSSSVINFVHGYVVPAIAILVFGLLGVRLVGEMAVLLFRLHEDVAQIRATLVVRGEPSAARQTTEPGDTPLLASDSCVDPRTAALKPAHADFRSAVREAC